LWRVVPVRSASSSNVIPPKVGIRDEDVGVIVVIPPKVGIRDEDVGVIVVIPPKVGIHGRGCRRETILAGDN
jgi:hypothetical protein